jgi:hypothetical protein
MTHAWCFAPQRLKHLPTFTSVFLGLCLLAPNAWCQTQGTHTSREPLNQFIDPSELEGNFCLPTESKTQCQNDLNDEAKAYYRAIGIYEATSSNSAPVGTAARGTFKVWKETLGFSPDPNTLTAGETRATYFNNGDLQFGRDMHCRTQSNLSSGPIRTVQSVTYACYVSNFSTSGQPGPSADPIGSVEQVITASPHGPIATVVMETTAVPHFTLVSSAGRKIAVPSYSFGDVRFFAYFKDDSPLTTAQLDSEGQKALPGLCLACHGGTYQSSAQGIPRVFSRGNFLPFDTSTFIFAPDATVTEVAQRESFRKLNQFVKSTNPLPTITDLIDGWYQWCGGVGKAGCYTDEQNHPFIPGESCSNNQTCPSVCPTLTDSNGNLRASNSQVSCGWGNATGIAPTEYGAARFDARAFYTQVIAKECRTCHVALADRFNLENYNVWHEQQSLVESDVFGTHRMPYGEVPFVDFWSGKPGTNGEAAKDFMKGYFGCPPFVPDMLSGDGSDSVTVSVTANTVPIDQVQLSLNLGNNVTGCPDHCWWKAINLAGFEVGEQDATQSGSIIIPVDVVTLFPSITLKKAKEFGRHEPVQTVSVPAAPFTYGGCTITFQWNKDR